MPSSEGMLQGGYEAEDEEDKNTAKGKVQKTYMASLDSSLGFSRTPCDPLAVLPAPEGG